MGLAVMPQLVLAAEPDAVQAPTGASATAPHKAPSAAQEELDELKSIAQAPLSSARYSLRKIARTSTVTDARATAIRALAQRDPTSATARICARVLRIDVEAKVRRGGAECLGRLPEPIARTHTPVLVEALDDEDIDVATMAAWALSNVGGAEALGALAQRTTRETGVAATYFYDYTERHRIRHRLRYSEDASGYSDTYLVPSATKMYPLSSTGEAFLAVTWAALYAGSATWLTSGLYTTTYGGPLKNTAPFIGAGAFAIGALAGGTYSFLRADDLLSAHTFVQMGTLGTAAGFGLGAISTLGATNAALNMSTFGLAGSIAGTAIGVVMNETRQPSSGALALGAVAGFGSGFAFVGLASGYGWASRRVIGAGLFAGGVTGALTTLAVGDRQIGLLPSLGALVGGSLLAGVLVPISSVVSTLGNANDPALFFSPASGWTTVGSWAVGAVAGAGLTMLLPQTWDPFYEFDALKIQPPTISFLEHRLDPRQLTPVGVVQASF